MKLNKVTIYSWPVSQQCLECIHGEFFQSETFNSSDAMCFKAVEDFDGVSCEFFKSEEDIHDAYLEGIMKRNK